MGDRGEVSVCLSLEELLALSKALGLTLPPSVGIDLGAIPADAQEALLDAARRALIARGAVALDPDGGITVHDALGRTVRTLLAPGILARALFETGGAVQGRFYGAMPNVAVEHRFAPGPVHCLTPFRTEDLLRRILAFAGLQPRSTVDVEALPLTLHAINECAERLLADDPGAAEAGLVSAGAPPAAAAAFVAALRNRVSSASVTILSRPQDRQLQGGELTWIDGGDQGLWRTPIPTRSPLTEGDEDMEASVEVSPTTAPAIAAELLSYLPGSSDASEPS